MANSFAPSGSLVPLYRQVSDSLVKAIMEGEFSAGAALPSEEALCAQFGVSRITVRKALDELVERRLVTRRRGVGTFVGDGRGGDGTWSVTLTGFIEEVLSPHRLTVIREAMVRPAADLLEFAKLPAGTKLKLFEGTNYIADGEPLVHLHYYFPEAVAAHLSAEAMAGTIPPFRLAEQALGVAVDRAEQIVEPMIANGRVARHLKVPRGTAVLRAIRAYYDRHGRLMEIFDAAYHPTHYRYTATLYPRAGGGAAASGIKPA